MNEAQKVAKRVIDDVLGGELRPGDPVKEAYYKKVLGVSKGTFREAIAELAAFGYVERNENRSPRIISPTLQQAVEAIDFRIEVEGSAIKRLCMQGLSEKAEEVLEKCVSIAEKTSDRLTFNKADALFHYNIMTYSRGQYGAKFIRRLFFVIFTHQAKTVGQKPMEDVAREHRAILNAIKDAIAKDDPSIAFDKLKEHLEETKARIGGEILAVEEDVDDFEDYASSCLVAA